MWYPLNKGSKPTTFVEVVNVSFDALTARWQKATDHYQLGKKIMEKEILKKILAKDERTNVTMTSADFLLLVEMYVEKKKQEEDEERYLTRDEASKFFSCDLSTLWRLEKKGVLPVHRLGKRPYYKKADLVRLMEGGAR